MSLNTTPSLPQHINFRLGQYYLFITIVSADKFQVNVTCEGGPEIGDMWLTTCLSPKDVSTPKDFIDYVPGVVSIKLISLIIDCAKGNHRPLPPDMSASVDAEVRRHFHMIWKIKDGRTCVIS